LSKNYPLSNTDAQTRNGASPQKFIASGLTSEEDSAYCKPYCKTDAGGGYPPDG
jgi:hypothetical protein